MTLTRKILFAMAAGIVVGALLGAFGSGVHFVQSVLVDGVLYVIGQVFLRLLQVMVVPLVLASLVVGVTSLGDLRALGRVGAKTLGLYVGTTLVAITLALALAFVVSPGRNLDLAGATFESRAVPPVTDVLINIFPSNPIRALADGEMLQIIVFALLLGFSISLSGQSGRRIAGLFADFNEIMMKMVLIVIKTAPLGVFALIARTFATQGLAVFAPLAGYFLTVVAGLMAQALVTYTLVLRASGLNPATFFRKMRTVMTFSFSTSSSSATIPVTLETLEHRHGVPNSIASFTIPLGATINMDGTAIMQGVATVFIANAYGVQLAPTDYVTVVLTATLASIGTAAVPSAGLIMLTIVLRQVGLPIEGIGLILGVDRLLDMLRTSLNVMGDAVVTCAVARSENALDLATYNDPRAVVVPAPASAGEDTSNATLRSEA